MLPASKSVGSALFAALILGSGCTGEQNAQTPSPSPTENQSTPPINDTETPTQEPVACSDDVDGDGYIDVKCEGGTDCDDVNVSVYPGASEGLDNEGTLIGDDIDNDCDDIIDEGTDNYDNDGDGYSERQGDCNDLAPGIYPGANEECDSVDNDCNGVIDDRDTDLDGHISAACGGDDCDDFNENTYPGAPEGPDSNGDGILEHDGADNDCDQIIDETTDIYDDDGDGYSELTGDCDDNDILVYPGAIERFDDKDQNCDGDYSAVPSALAAPASVVGTLADATAGASIDGLGDVDGDGVGDLLIGAPSHDPEGTRTGAAFLLSGRASGWNVDMPIDTLPTFTLSGNANAAGALAGTAVAGVGDMTGDGKNDFVIGAPGYVANNNSNAGGIFLYQGQDTPFVDQVLGQQVSVGGSNSFGINENVEMGYSLSGSIYPGGCDVTGDGINDLLIGGPWDSSFAQGYLMILPGDSTTLGSDVSVTDLTSFPGAFDSAIGYSVSCLGDTDGVAEPTGAMPADILVAGKGSADYAGLVHWLPGSTDYQSTSPRFSMTGDAVQFTGTAGGEFVGYTTAGIPDQNADGLGEFAFGREVKAGDGTLAHVVYSNAGNSPQGGVLDSISHLRIVGAEDDKCPCAVKDIGDFNLDGYNDILLSASRAGGSDELPTESGRVYLFLGSAEGLGQAGTSVSVDTANYAFAGAAAGEQFGAALAHAGDLNGDGFPDFAVGAPYADGGSDEAILEEAGKIYVFFGFPLN